MWFVFRPIVARLFSHVLVYIHCSQKTTAVPSITKYVITPELYTTKYRAVGLGSASVWTRIGGEYNVGHQTCDAVAGPLGNYPEFLSIATKVFNQPPREPPWYPSFSSFAKVMAPRVEILLWSSVVYLHVPTFPFRCVFAVSGCGAMSGVRYAGPCLGRGFVRQRSCLAPSGLLPDNAPRGHLCW